jgi:hypothetical protein
MAPTATILHADLDAFYASVEQLLDPSLRGKPIAVGGGVVLAASYEARAFGVRGGMPGRRARELCPELIFVSGHFKDYQRLGDAAIKVLGDFTPLVERISIDEAFADVAGCTHLFGSPAEIAGAIRARVRSELGLPISVGVARTKHLAKIASQVAKPDGLVAVDPARELDFLHGLSVELMGASARSRKRGSPKSAWRRSVSSPTREPDRSSGCSVPRPEKNSPISPGIAISGASGLTTAPDRPAPSRRLAENLPWSGSSGQPCFIWPIASRRGCGRRRGPAAP